MTSQLQKNRNVYGVDKGADVSVNTKMYLKEVRCDEVVTFLGPEDDSIRIEICRPNTITNIIKFWRFADRAAQYIYLSI